MPISPCGCCDGRLAWYWADAFNKSPFNESLCDPMTELVSYVLEDAGFDVEFEKWQWNRYIIESLRCPLRGELLPDPAQRHKFGCHNPRDYLPGDVVALLDRELPDPRWSLREAFLRLRWALRSFHPRRQIYRGIG